MPRRVLSRNHVAFASLFLVAASLALWPADSLGLQTVAQPDKTEIMTMPLDKLIANLEAADGKVRTAATGELFRRGKMNLPNLKKAGAKQIAPVGGTIDNTRRLDMVYSILEGFPQNGAKALAGYLTDSFGVTFAKGATPADSDALAQKYVLTPQQLFRNDSIPNCYYKLAPGQKLEDTLRQVLTQEEKVWRINLNYYER